jgi:hypothetical protein
MLEVRSMSRVLSVAFVLLFTVPALAKPPSENKPCAVLVAASARPQNFAEWLMQSSSFADLPPTRLDLPVLVVGAGPGGLVQIRELLNRRIAVEAVERHSDIGGLWNHSNPQSPAYDSLRMDTSRATSHFGEPGEKNEWPDYFDRQTALEFLKEYARRHALMEKIRLNVAVTRLEKDPAGAWRAFFSDGTSRLYRAVAIASGKYNRQTAEIPASLRAQAEVAKLRWLHSSEYRNPGQSGLAGEQVLVVGASNSAIDIATELAHTAERVWLSVRSTRWFIPEYVFGIPSDEFATSGPKLPHWLEMPIFKLLQRLLVGHPRSFGFAAPDHALLDKLPVPDRGILRAIQDGKVQLRSNVDKIEPDGSVRFAPSTQPSDELVRPTAIVFATGYHRAFPFLPQDLQVEPEKFPLLAFHPTERGLFFLIEPTVPEGAWGMLSESAQTIAGFLVAESQGRESVLKRFDGARLSNPPDYKGHLFRAEDNLHVDPDRFRKLHSDARAFFQGQ